MGLPLFRTPVERDVALKAADKSTAVSRSTIRRRAIQDARDARARAEARRYRIITAGIEGENEALGLSDIQRSSHPNEIELPSSAFFQPRTMMRMFEQEPTTARDPPSFERQQPASTEDSPPMPPVPESRDYAGSDERQRIIYRARQIRSNLHRARGVDLAPRTGGDPAFSSRTESPRLSTSMTPVLSPSHRPSAQISDSPPRRTLEESDFGITVRSYTESPAQALNRQSRNMERLRLRNRRRRVDGLGDRDRSLSPEGSAAWDTLLTSITPDPQAPSAGSSFASTSAAAAAAAASSGSGPSTAGTSLTSLSRGVEHECDLSESGSNTEDEEDIYELQEYSRSRGESLARTYAEAVAARADRATRNDTEHLSGLHRIISRMARRDDVPDAWWLSAGLSRNLRPEPTN